MKYIAKDLYTSKCIIILKLKGLWVVLQGSFSFTFMWF